MKRVLFIDRDGTLIVEPQSDMQVDSIDKLEFVPGVFRNLYNIQKYLDFELVIVSNQDGLGTASYPEATFWPAHKMMIKTFENEGIKFSQVHIDPSMPNEKSPNRKPGIGMLKRYFSEEYDLAGSFVIGDRISDVGLAKNMGAKAIFFATENRSKELFDNALAQYCALQADNWDAIFTFLSTAGRTATIRRKTSETDIFVELKLDGKGMCDIATGLGFFDHMLQQIGRHSGCDLSIKVTGDLVVDEHHTIEDTAIALGEAFRKALGDKYGIERYGFCLPMDDCLAQVVLDFGGRSWLVWEAEFLREKVGDVPTEMFFHFFKSFSDSSLSNLNIKAEGTNEHHKIEAIFKAFARALKMAIRKDPFIQSLPSTKGLL